MTRLILAPLLALLLSMPWQPAGGEEAALLPLHFDAEEDRLLLEIQQFDQPMIYANTLATGLGTPSPLIDRADTGASALVVFERHGKRVLLVRENTIYGALDDNPALVQSVRESFPRSVLAAFEIVEDRDGTVVDATDFFLSDVFCVAARLKAGGLGTAKPDRDRSHIVRERTAAFPLNSEIRASVTFSLDEPDAALARQAPDARSVTFEQQHSFLALPEDDYRPREYHPRSGAFPLWRELGPPPDCVAEGDSFRCGLIDERDR